jgi:nucleotide-binding universal stress UspA family protein
MKTILVPLDGTALAEQVLPHVRVLAPALGAKIRLLRVVSDRERESLLGYDMLALYGMAGDALNNIYEHEQRRWDALRQQAHSYLEIKADELREQGLEVETEVAFGTPARQIVEVAEREQASLIAMAAHDYSSLQRWTIGSVTDKVVHATSTPFFILRGDEHLAEVAEQ